MLLRACVSIIGLAMMLALLVFAGCTAIMQPLSEEIQSRSAVAVAHEQTLQTEMEWDAKVQIESGRADASKKTSFEYVMFYAIRFGIWLIVLLLLVLVARLAWNKYIESVEAQSL